MQQPTKLIFLPGAAGNPQFWSPVSSLLGHSASRKLIGWPGFGGNPVDPDVQGIEDLVALVEAEIDQPVALIAQSMGGVIALQAALRRPEHVTHLVLAVTAGGVDMSDVQARDWRPAFFEANPTAPSWFADYNDDISSQIRSIQAPALLLWGDADPVSPVVLGHRFKELLPTSSLQVVPGGAHDLANKFADSVAPLIDAHLRAMC